MRTITPSLTITDKTISEMTPIWKDYEVSLADYESPQDYTIRIGGATIFSGRAMEDPLGSMVVRLNGFAADYLSNPIPSHALAGTDGADTAAVKALAQLYVGSTLVGGETFTYDYSYTNDGTDIRNAPINGRYVQGMPIILTRLSSALAFDVVLTGGNPEEFDDTIEVAAGTGNYTLQTDGYIVVAVEQMGDYEYKAVQRCGKSYALYYLNEFGGWDFLLFEGRCSKTDTYARQTLKAHASNAVQGARNTREYANEVTRKWELRTGWLSDEEAALMHHLVGSPLAYLWDSESEKFRAVVITDTECPYKTQDGEGRGVVQYTINAVEALDMRRK